jgi:tRNA modification GTPase
MRPLSQRPGNTGDGYLSEQTIAAIASAVGGAIAIIRISGPRAFEALTALAQTAFQSQGQPFLVNNFEPRKLYRATLHSVWGEPLDDAMFVRFVNPESFTGEDVVELHVHGGNFTASRILEELAKHGVRQALPGEFSFRAVRNGKMSLTQAQAISDLIESTNDGAATLALEKLSGTQNRLLSTLAEDLRKLAVLGEVGIDFSDQDVDEVSLPTLKKRVAPLLETLLQLRSSFDRGVRLQDGIGVAFVGLPNAGKSSFFNALLGEDRSIVSDIAGTTRDVIRERITIRGKTGSITLKLEDTAGLRHAEDLVEKKGIERSQQAASRSDLILFIVDSTASSEKDLEALASQWESLHLSGHHSGSGKTMSAKTIGILTKCDLVPSENLPTLEAKLRHTEISRWLKTSAQTGAGIAEASDEIAAFCERLIHRQKGEVLLTRADQLDAVFRAVGHLQRAQNAPEIDLFASDVRQALHSLGPLIGATLPDDILGQIFSSFCIGK